MRNAYKVLAEKYSTLTEERVVRQIPFADDELKVLKALYDFKEVEGNPAELNRIVAAGELETIVKYSDNTFVRMTDEARGIIKHEYKNFFELTKMLSRIYKPNSELNTKQIPKGKSMPMGTDLTPGGQQ